MRIPAAALLLAGASAAAARQAPAPADVERGAAAVFAAASPSVVVVLALDRAGSVTAQGSGVVVGPGLVVTNRHVVDGAASVRLQHRGNTRSARVMELHLRHDLATLRTSLAAPAVPTRASAQLAVGERVFAIGAPQGLDLSLSEGLVSQLRAEAGAFRIQTTAAISAGSSGGGLFDEQGRLVGITSYSSTRGQQLNFALPTEWVDPMVKAALARAAERNRVTLRPERRMGATRIVIEGDGTPLVYAWRSSDASNAVVEIESVDASGVPARVDVGSAEVVDVALEAGVREGRELSRFHVRLAAPMRQRVYPEGGNLNLVFERVGGIPPADPVPSPPAAPAAPQPTPGVTAAAAGSAPTRLQGVRVEPDGEGAFVWLEMGPGATFHDFVLENPDRVVIDLLGFDDFGATSGAAAIVKRVRVARHSREPPVVRVVVDLARPADHLVSFVGDGLLLALQPVP